MTEESKIVEAKKRRTEENIERNNLCKNCKKIILYCFGYFICHEGYATRDEGSSCTNRECYQSVSAGDQECANVGTS